MTLQTRSLGRRLYHSVGSYVADELGRRAAVLLSTNNVSKNHRHDRCSVHGSDDDLAALILKESREQPT